MLDTLQNKSFNSIFFSNWLLRLLLFFLVMLISGTVYAQNTSQVSGKVTGESSGKAMPGVNITVKGTATGTSTDANGSYQLQVPSLRDTLIFSFIGYRTQNVPIKGRSTINVRLSSSTSKLGNLVVVGYSSKQKQNITGAVSEVDVADLTKQPVSNPTEQLQGQASGVRVVTSGQPGEAPNIIIRGENTFGNNSPLYVVDGIPTTSISSLNPDNIASMNVLKDAAAASIYGARASNGVIVVTTKKGQKGNVQVDYNAYGGFSVPPQGNVWNKANPQETAQIYWNATKNAGGDVTQLTQYYNPDNPSQPHVPDYIDPPNTKAGDPAVDPSKYFIDPYYTDPTELSSFYYITKANKQGTDWFHQVFSPAATMNQNISVSGGSDIGNYLFSANYRNDAGIIQNQYLKRYSLRANSSFNVGSNIQIGENLSYSVTDNPQIASQTEAGPIGYAMRENPIIPVYDIMGNYAGTHAAGLGNAINPVEIADNNRRTKNQTNRLFGNVFAQVDLWKHRVTVKTIFGGNYNNGFYHAFQFPQYSRNENTSVNQFTRSSNEDYDYTWTNTARFKQSFMGVHNVKLLAGMEAHREKGSGQSGTTQSFFSFDPAYVNLGSGSGTRTNSSYQYENTLFSLFGRLDYNYKQKYLVSATLRRDGSSKFLNDRYGFFPAGSIGWRLSNEPFFNVSWINNLKFRAGYGVLGNQLNVNANNPYTLYLNSNIASYYAIDGSNSNNRLGFQQNTVGNPDAQWEKDINLNVGIDATLFNGGLTVNASYYRKRIKDLLYNPNLPGTAGGAAPPYVNVGAMGDNGLDISLKTLDHINSNIQFNAKVTFTTYHNKIKEISQTVKYFSQEARRFNGHYIIRNAVGHPVSSFFGYKVIGFWNSQKEINQVNAKAQQATGDKTAVYQTGIGLGRFRYQDVNGDGQITPADRTFIGNPNPDFTYGINLGFDYKSIDFSMFWYGSQGNDIWDQVKYYHDFANTFKGGKSKALLYDSWTPQNHNASLPINSTKQTISDSKVPNSFFVENGSYLRLKNVEVGYTLPQTFLQKFDIQKLRVYVQAANLLTITPYPGVDPEVGYFPGTNGGTSTSFGIDSGTYPTMHKYLVGINLTF